MADLLIFLCGAVAGAFCLWVWGAVTVRAILARGQKLLVIPWGQDEPPAAAASTGESGERDLDDPDWWKKR